MSNSKPTYIAPLSDKSSDPDALLLDRLKRGDETALSDLIDRHIKKIHAVAYRMLGDRMQAEDVAQMVFLNFWQTAPNWESGRGRVLTYLYRVTTHRCLDILRKSKETFPGELPDIEDHRPDALDKLHQNDQRIEIESALAQLSHRQRVALTLFYYEHQSLKDASKILEMTPSAFESLLRRARQSLKSFLNHDIVETIL